LQLDFATGMLPLMGYMLVVFIIVQLIDNFVFQPLIFSNSVNAHPLEIFIVLLIAGSLGGILGMLLAIPGYTVLRVFAKEFFNKFRLVQKLTEKI
jgi:predicted PurR-regulated permease PerM